MTYCEELKLLIIDKLLIGIIIVILGYTINRILEKYKIKVAILKEYTIARINKISDTWNILIEIEEDSQFIIDKVFEIRNFITSSFEEQTKAIIRETSKLDEELKLKFDLVNKALRKNHFWIGNEYYKKFSSYKDSIIEYYQAVVQNKDLDFGDMKKRLNDNKEDLINIVKGQIK